MLIPLSSAWCQWRHSSAAADSSTGTQRRAQVFAQKRYCDRHNNERDVLDAIEYVKAKEVMWLIV